MVGGEVRIEGKAEEALLRRLRDEVRDVEERGGQAHAISQDDDLAGLLDDEEAVGVAGGCRHVERLDEPRGDAFEVETWRRQHGSPR